MIQDSYITRGRSKNCHKHGTIVSESQIQHLQYFFKFILGVKEQLKASLTLSSGVFAEHFTNRAGFMIQES